MVNFKVRILTIDLRIGFMLSSKPGEILAHSQNLLWRGMAVAIYSPWVPGTLTLVKHRRKCQPPRWTYSCWEFIYISCRLASMCMKRSKGISWSYPSSCSCTGCSCGYLAIIRSWLSSHMWVTSIYWHLFNVYYCPQQYIISISSWNLYAVRRFENLHRHSKWKIC